MSNTEAQSSKLASYFLNDLNLIYTINTDSIFDKVVFTALVNNILNKKWCPTVIITRLTMIIQIQELFLR